MGNVILDLSSKKFDVIELKTVHDDINIHFDLIAFEGEAEYKKASKPSDFIGGNIISMFHDAQNCFLRDTLFMAKRRNPKLIFFILKKKGF